MLVRGLYNVRVCQTIRPCDGAAEAARAWLPPKPVGDAAELLALAEHGGSGPLPVNVKASSNRIAPEAITAHAARIARGVENSVMISYCRRNASGVKRIYDAFVAQAGYCQVRGVVKLYRANVCFILAGYRCLD